MSSSDCGPKQCVLAIDDEESFLDFLKEALEGEGYNVFTVSSPLEAIWTYEERSREIDVVLLDYTLPPMWGDFVFDELQRLNPDVRVVLVTGSAEPVAYKLFRKGLRGYLQKPFSLSDLSQTVQDALSTYPADGARVSR
jgi:DNA-binding NtrC family response regulator